ncbi:ubiquitin-conjugating enzyme/RWD-like protein [Daedaleopsis nitida]|nr:ubiquitin-conjugating enzyme/RWD-like protein [Daedaleopsis nitida]
MSISSAVIRRLMRELNELRTNPPDGIRVVVNEDNMLDVTGIVEGPEGTPYAGGYFRVRFNFTEEFPAAPPKCWFATKIFHPNVSTAGEICVNTLKKDWKSSYGIGHILVTVKCLLIYPNPESALDEEAGKLLLEDYNSYCDRARLITSVHATPKVRPVEFNTPSKPDTSLEASSIPVPSASSSSTTPTLPATPVSAPASKSIPSSKSSPVPVVSSQPLHPSTPNTYSTSPSASSLSATEKVTPTKERERHVSPSPLGTADSNVAVGVQATTGGGTKAVKRTAVSAGAGGEKRKKALKRL